MWRYWAGALAALLLAGAAMFLFRSSATADVLLPPPAAADRCGISAAERRACGRTCAGGCA
ncbi:hypothetical protein [Sphingomonas spermidinifaciens]|uniref:hypothetical protein n=1 Tax=Sphingomonas spermidinifaciens TaxID=1141889 RepID=UPI001FE5BD13|nr:hypothetical protein [Sphingomonas spermidinifaciens]